MSIVLTEFARPRLFPAQPRRNTIQDITAEEFERYLNEHEPLKVLPGYAPFCVLHVHRNWTSTRCLTVPITDANRHLLRSDYEAPSSTAVSNWPGRVRPSTRTGAWWAACTPANRRRSRWRRSR